MSGVPDIDDTELRILCMLHEGVNDATIARRLGVGHRTVQRRVHDLMQRWEVTGRFALGAHAQEVGLLGVTRDEPSRDIASNGAPRA
ncbi:LuxR C-terminal-related transcriptional regulator [Streptomyces sp. NBC_00234]|uniref:LuxR C-terminal-related transcriptional regulator n=1 Tax=Streptomyces sp. NBC_00234 TaxID=2903638 RepID=UPI002E2D99A2|nr:LuxR C-terminal-related transcriptional regulator [Streptomyces sp. NBC_00234]